MPRLIATDIARALKQRITSGEWSDSRRIPAERDLASDFGVARNTIRRAMELLEEDGAISRHVGRGTFITATENPSLADMISGMEGASPADMMEVRLLLEPAAAAFAATNASKAKLASVEEAHQAALAAAEMPDFEHWDAEFHQRIFACSRNELLREIHNVLRVLRNQAPWFEMKKRSFSDERRQKYCAEHEAIMASMLRRDPDGARTAMLAHLRTVATNMLGR
jgi:DNA-binding FadR family transcriptional regulator